MRASRLADASVDPTDARNDSCPVMPFGAGVSTLLADHNHILARLGEVDAQ
jgi:hypothetical protein